MLKSPSWIRYEQPTFDPALRKKRIERYRFRPNLDAFLAQEGAVALVQMSRTEGRLVHGEGYGYRVGKTPKLPGLELAAEDYRKLTRLAKRGEVRLEIDSRVHFEDADHNAYNTFADIPGDDPHAGYVMAGAHLDSWVAGDGAADNGAGSAVIMEAARILASLGVHPKRTIRFALWAGEEEGLLGSEAYVEKHLAHRPLPTDPAEADLPPFFLTDMYPVQTLPGFADLAAYFNLDNGSGRIRGIYAEGNFAVVPILHEWLSPFSSLGASAVVAEPTGATDHVFFSRLGLPAFQFIQDPLDYEHPGSSHRPRYFRSSAPTRFAAGRGRASDGSRGRGEQRQAAAAQAAANATGGNRSVRVSGSEQEIAREVPKLWRYACFRRPRRKSAMISRAALWPGAPVTPPPGCVPEPHMYRPFKGPR